MMKSELNKEIQRFPILGVQISAVNLTAAVNIVEEAIINRMKSYVCVCPVSTIMACQEDGNMRRIVNAAYLATPDGMPTVWIGKSRGFKDMGRVYGPDLMLAVCALSAAKGYRQYFYGATSEVLDKLKNVLLNKFPGLKIVGSYAPAFRPLS